MRRPFLVFTLVAAATLLLDQASKAIVRSALPVGDSIPIVPGIFYLTHIRNEGAAFGLMQGRQPVFIAVTCIVLGSIFIYWWRTRGRERPWPIVIALGLITGGALGNLIDRVTANMVTDFLDAAVVNFPVFNLADSAIFCGTVLLVIWLLFFDQPAPEGPLPAGGEGEGDRQADS